MGKKFDKIGLIGLGVMGYGLGLNLAKNGYTVYANDIAEASIDRMVAVDPEHIIGVKDSRDILKNTNVVITMVPNSPQVMEVIDKIFSDETKIPADMIFIDMSSISPVATREIARQLEDKHITFVEGPVSGGQSGAMNGTLTIMAAGRKEAFDRVHEIFEAVGKNIIYCGESGCGQAVKVANQLMSAVNLAGMAEAFELITKYGVNPEIAMNVIRNGSGRCWAIEDRMPQILKGNFKPGFKIDLHTKDIKLATSMAESENLPLPVSNLVCELFKTAQNKGLGKEDNCAIIKLYEELGGVPVRSKN